MSASVERILFHLRTVAKTPREQGELFERFVAAYLRRDGYYGQLFSNVWRWSEWPGRGNEIDSGIDLVAEERESGALWAIQAKFHSEQISFQDISTFLALSGRKEFSYRMIVTTAPLSSTAEQALEHQEKPVVILSLSNMLESPINWDEFNWNNPDSNCTVTDTTNP